MDSLDAVTKKNLIKYLEKNPVVPSSSNKILALKKKNKPVNLLKKKKKIDSDTTKITSSKMLNQKLNADVQMIDFNFTELSSEQQKHSNTTPSKKNKIALKRSFSSLSDRNDEINNIAMNTPSKLPRLKSLSERKKIRYDQEINKQQEYNNEYANESTPSKISKNSNTDQNTDQKIQMKDVFKEITDTPTKKKSFKVNQYCDSSSSMDNCNYNIHNSDKFSTPKKIQKSIYSNVNNGKSNDNDNILNTSKQYSITTPTKSNKLKKVETTPHKSFNDINHDNSKESEIKSSIKKKKNSSVLNSPSLATPYMLKQNLIKKFKTEVPEIRIEALKELLNYFKTSKVNKIGSSLQINEGVMSFLNAKSDEILREILDEHTLDILLKTRVISIEQLIPKIIDMEIKINKQKNSSNNNNNNSNNNNNNDNENIYSEFAIGKINNIINWIKQEKFTVPIMKNIIVELIARNGKSRRKYNNVNEILECLLEWIIELLINDMSENIFYMNNKTNNEMEIDYKIGKRNPCIFFKNENNILFN